MKQAVFAYLTLEGLDLPPFLDDGKLFLGKVNRHVDKLSIGQSFQAEQVQRQIAQTGLSQGYC